MVNKRKAKILIRQWGDFTDRFFATVLLPEEGHGLVYDTEALSSREKALEEARSFCKWKGLRVKKIEDRSNGK